MRRRILLLSGLATGVFEISPAIAKGPLDLRAANCHEMRDKVMTQLAKFRLGTTDQDRQAKLEKKCKVSRIVNQLSQDRDPNVPSNCDAIFTALSNTIDDADRIHDEACSLLDQARAAADACTNGQSDCMKEPATYFKQAAAKLKEVEDLIPQAREKAQQLRDIQRQNLRIYSGKLRVVSKNLKANGADALNEKVGPFTVKDFLAQFENMDTPTAEQLDKRASQITDKADHPGSGTYDDNLAQKLSSGVGRLGGEGVASIVATTDFDKAARQIDQSLDDTVKKLDSDANRTLAAGSSLTSPEGTAKPPFKIPQGGLSADPGLARDPAAPAPSAGNLRLASSSGSAPVLATGASRAVAFTRPGAVSAPSESGATTPAASGGVASAEFAIAPEAAAAASPTVPDSGGTKGGIAQQLASPYGSGEVAAAPVGGTGSKAGSGAGSGPDSHASAKQPAAQGPSRDPASESAANVASAGKAAVGANVPFTLHTAGLADSLRRALAARLHPPGKEQSTKPKDESNGAKTVGEVLRGMREPAAAERQPFVLGESDAEVHRLLGSEGEISNAPGVLGSDSRDLFGRVHSAHRRFENHARMTLGAAD